MAINQQANLTVTLNNEQAKRELAELQAEMKRLIDLRDKAQQAGDLKLYKQLDAQLKKATREARNYEKQLFDVGRVLRDINGASMNDLLRAKKVLIRQTQELSRNTREYVQASGQLRQVNAEMTRISNSTRATGSAFQNLVGGFNKYFGLVTAFAASFGAIVLGFRKLRTVIYDFEEHITNVYTLLSEADYLKFKDILAESSIDMIRRYGFEIKDVNKALFDTISAGVSAADAVQFMDNAAKLAVGGVTKLSVAVDGMTSIYNAYGLAAGDTEKISASFFSAQKYGKTTVEQLAGSIGSVVPIAASAGVSYQELLSAVAALTTQGLSTDMAMTAIKNSIMAIIKPTDTAAKTLKEFGVPIGFTEIRAKGLGYTLERLNELIRENPDAISEAIPNIRGLLGVTALSGKGLEKYNEILKQVNTDYGQGSSLVLAYSKQMETAAQKLDKRKGQITATIIEMKDTLLPLFSAVLKYTNLTFRGLMATLTLVSRYIGLLKMLAYSLGAYVAAVKLLTLWQGLSNKQSAINITLSKAQVVLNHALKGATLLLSGAWALVTGNITRATASMRLFTAVTRLNPVGLIVSALTVAYIWWGKFSGKTREATSEIKAFNEELERGMELANTRKSINERAALMKSMTQTQLANLQYDIQNQLEMEDEFRIQLLGKLKQRLQEDQELQQLYEARKGRDLTHAQKINLDALINARRQFLARELQDMADQGKKRKELLVKQQKEVNAELAAMPTEKTQAILVEDEKLREAREKFLRFLQETNEEMQFKLGQYFRKAGENAMEEFFAAIDKKRYAYRDLINQFQFTPEQEESDVAVEYALEKYQKSQEGRHAMLVARFRAGKISEQQYQDELTEIVREQEEERLRIRLDNAEKASQLSRLAVNLVATLMDYELEKAGDNEEEKVKIRKKYANVQFLVSASQIVTDTAASIMKGFSELGPIAGAVAAVLLGATGAAQLAIANQERKKMQGYRSGGYTRPGNRDEPAGIVHAGEYVIPQEGVNNPRLREVIDIMELARRNNALHRINIRPVVEGMPVHGFAAGGHVTPSKSVVNHNTNNVVSGITPEHILRFEKAIDKLTRYRPPVAIEQIARGLDTWKEIETNRSM